VQKRFGAGKLNVLLPGNKTRFLEQAMSTMMLLLRRTLVLFVVNGMT
jgi:hypothetical protein